MDGLAFTRFADAVTGPAAIAEHDELLPLLLILSVIVATVLLIRHFKSRKK